MVQPPVLKLPGADNRQPGSAPSAEVHAGGAVGEQALSWNVVLVGADLRVAVTPARGGRAALCGRPPWTGAWGRRTLQHVPGRGAASAELWVTLRDCRPADTVDGLPRGAGGVRYEQATRPCARRGTGGAGAAARRYCPAGLTPLTGRPAPLGVAWMGRDGARSRRAPGYQGAAGSGRSLVVWTRRRSADGSAADYPPSRAASFGEPPALGQYRFGTGDHPDAVVGGDQIAEARCTPVRGAAAAAPLAWSASSRRELRPDATYAGRGQVAASIQPVHER